VSRPSLVRGTAGLCLVVAALLVGAGATDGGSAPGALVVACVLLGVLASGTWVLLGVDRRRERREARVALRRARRPVATPVAGGRETATGLALALAGVVLVLLALQSILGISFWALVLLGTGAFVLWAQTTDLPSADADRPLSGWQRLAGRRSAGRDGVGPDGVLLASGVGLVVLGALVALSGFGALATSRVALLQLGVAIAAITLVVAPFWRRSARRAQAERSERIRGDERAEVAAHLHDSVLQTLALIRRRSDDPREVAQLARRQERELRTWLSGRSQRPDDELMAALRAAAAAVEVEHRVEIEVVTIGERPLDDRTAALVAAAREAMANAARHACPAASAPGAAGDPVVISVFAEAEDGRIEVFVRDRGRGFDPDALPADRRGVRESILGRMRRAGGRATIHSAPGEGTEVELLLEDRP
jgi:signal transduction histidine kinase